MFLKKLATFVFFSATLAGCSTAPQKDSSQDAAALAEANAKVSALEKKLQQTETSLQALNEKFDSIRISIDNYLASQPAPSSSGVALRPNQTLGQAPEAVESGKDPEKGFAHDSSVQEYRRGMILFRGEKYPDSILAFSAYVEKYPDSVLAGAAQYHVGESYFRLSQYRQAIQEFQKVLTSYDRSSHLAATLRRMAEAEDLVQEPEAAARHRQMLMSLFPGSPSAAGIKELAARPAPPPRTDAPAGNPASNLDEPPASGALAGGTPPTAPAGEKQPE